MIARRRVLVGISALILGIGAGLWTLRPHAALILQRRRLLETLSGRPWRRSLRRLDDGFVMVDGWVLKSTDLESAP